MDQSAYVTNLDKSSFKAEQGTPRLLQLPAEIRERIWTYATPQAQELQTNICPCLDYPGYACQHYKKQTSCAFWRDSVNLIFSPLPLVNRQINRETRHLCSKPKDNKPAFCSPECLKRFLTYLTFERRRALRSCVLSIDIPTPPKADVNSTFNRDLYFHVEETNVEKRTSHVVKKWYFAARTSTTEKDYERGRVQWVVKLRFPIRRGIREHANTKGRGMLGGDTENAINEQYQEQEERAEVIRAMLEGTLPEHVCPIVATWSDMVFL